MSLSLPYDKLYVIWQLAHSLLKTQPVTVHQLMSFLGKTIFYANGYAQYCHLCHVIWNVKCLSFSGSPAFVLFTFLFQLCISFRDCLSCNRVQFTCNIFILMQLLLQVLYPVIGPFILGFCVTFIFSKNLVRFYAQDLYTLIRTSDCYANIVWKAFCLSGKVLTLYLHNRTVKAYLCNQCGSFSFSFQASQQHFEYGWQAWYYSYSSIHIYPSQCGSWLYIMRTIGSKMVFSSPHS